MKHVERKTRTKCIGNIEESGVKLRQSIEIAGSEIFGQSGFGWEFRFRGFELVSDNVGKREKKIRIKKAKNTVLLLLYT